jgi:2-polyprenyl-6-methoxyphenol hydroxylase-like FAD-dependent oxidoreductase
MAATTTDVLISGAGAAGLALAIELGRRNVPFLLIDKSPQPFHGSRGKGIQPRTQEVFEDMGIVDCAFAAGGLYPVQREYKDGGFVDEPMTEHRDPTPSEPYAMPLMLPQFLTEAILRDRLAELGHRVQFGHELTAFKQDAGGVRATVQAGAGRQTIAAKYLVGTDGGRSFVRQALGIDFPGRTLGVRALVADLDLDGLGDDAWHRWNEGTPDQISLCPLRGTTMFQLQAPVPLDGDVDLSVAGIAAMILRRTRRDDIRLHAVSWASVYSMNARLADRYRVARIFLAGDSAHIHPPTGGQGLNTSIQDSYNLGWKLAAALAGAPEIVLASYESERRLVAADVLGLSTKLLDAARASGNMRRGRETQQLDLAYPDSPLSLGIDLRLRTGPLLPGERAPDAPCVGSGGQPTRLFHLFRGTHWTLLGIDADRSAAKARKNLRIHTTGARGDIVDHSGHIREAYGEAPGWVLIRPDGYIGATVPASGLAALEQHVESLMSRSTAMKSN